MTAYAPIRTTAAYATIDTYGEDLAVLTKTVANSALMQYEPGEPFYYVDEPMPIAQLIATIEALADCAEATR